MRWEPGWAFSVFGLIFGTGVTVAFANAPRTVRRLGVPLAIWAFIPLAAWFAQERSDLAPYGKIGVWAIALSGVAALAWPWIWKASMSGRPLDSVPLQPQVPEKPSRVTAKLVLAEGCDGISTTTYYFLEIANSGPAATFHAKLKVSGFHWYPIGDVFCRWYGSDDKYARIASGDTRRLFLVERDISIGNESKVLWALYESGAGDNGTGRHELGTGPIAIDRADSYPEFDVVVTVYADPDLAEPLVVTASATRQNIRFSGVLDGVHAPPPVLVETVKPPQEHPRRRQQVTARVVTANQVFAAGRTITYFIEVTNHGAGAKFHATPQAAGAPWWPPEQVFSSWSGVGVYTPRIASGETLKIFFARFEEFQRRAGMGGLWAFYFWDGYDIDGRVDAGRPFLIDRPDKHPKFEVVVRVFAEPDLATGPLVVTARFNGPQVVFDGVST